MKRLSCSGYARYDSIFRFLFDFRRGAFDFCGAGDFYRWIDLFKNYTLYRVSKNIFLQKYILPPPTNRMSFFFMKNYIKYIFLESVVILWEEKQRLCKKT